MEKESKIYVAGHRGLVGSAILHNLQAEGYNNLVIRTHRELDLCNQEEVRAFFEKERPEYIFLAAAKVGGILANSTYPADFIYNNIAIQIYAIHNAYLYGVKKLLFLGSSCIYPKFAPQPMKEEYLLTGILEPTNEPYAIAKISGIKMCQAYNRQYGTNFISVMPTNLYGPGDNFDLETSHVLSALIRKFHEAKLSGQPVTVWGTGTPRREFLYVNDLAEACIFLMNCYDGEDIINIGTGLDISIKELAGFISEVIGYRGEIIFDTGKPDGMQRKLLDVTRINSLGWKAKTDLREGIEKTYKWYLST
ncbi:MAG TPA: GDP-fucose synthetase, partial [Nitrospiraceae bacterium]|nr:GDP-fucose synthetase [Nitrospiraceae bacterium]